jgi:hypothetical protein
MLRTAPITRRLLLVEGGALASTLLLAGPAPAAAAHPEGTVSYWHHFISQTEFAGLQRVVAFCEQRYPI